MSTKCDMCDGNGFTKGYSGNDRDCVLCNGHGVLPDPPTAAESVFMRAQIDSLTRELAEARSQRDGLAKATNNLCSIVNLAVHRGIGKDGPSEDDLKAYMKAALDAAKGGA